MKTSGIVLTVLGVIGIIVFGYQAVNQSESVELLGFTLAASSANWTPVIISIVITIAGILMTAVGKKKAGRQS